MPPKRSKASPKKAKASPKKGRRGRVKDDTPTISAEEAEKQSKGFLEVCRVLQNGQRSNATHKRLSGQLRTLQKRWNAEKEQGVAFEEALWRALRYAFPSSLSTAADKVMRLVYMLLSLQADNTLALFLLRKAAPITTSMDKHVRRNVCELISCCLAGFRQADEEDPEADGVLDTIADALHDRQDDKVVAVRCKAVQSSYIFQQPELGGQCDITQHYLQLLCQDVPQVRVAVMQRLQVSRCVVPHLLRSISDSSVEVRKAAYKHIARVPPRWFAMQQRCDLLNRGLGERLAELRKLTHHVIGNWLRREEGDAVAVLQLLDLEENEPLSTQLAEAIFDIKYTTPKLRDVKVPEGQAPPTLEEWDTTERDRLCSELSAEGMLMLRVIISRFKEKDSERVTTYMPQIDVAADLLKACIDSFAGPENSTLGDIETHEAGMLAEQTLKLCLVYEPDLHTEEQRQKMLAAIYTFANITEVDHPTRFVEPVILLFRHFYRHREEELYRLIMLIIDRLRRYMSTATGEDSDNATGEDLFFDAEAQSREDQKKQDEIAMLSARLEKAAPHQKQRVQDDLTALTDEANTDTALWIRILDIILQVTQQPRGTKITLQYADVALAASQSHWNGFVRAKALRVLAAYAVMQKQTAPTYTKVMLAALRKKTFGHSFQKRLTMKEALNGLFDTFLEHGAIGFFSAPSPPPGAQEDPEHIQELAKAAEASTVKVLDVLLNFASVGDYNWGGEDEEPLEAGETAAEILERRRLLQGTAAAGLAKLLACNRVPRGHEVRVLTQLLLFYSNPSFSSRKEARVGVDDATTHAMQVLAVFFPTYSFSSVHRQSLVKEAAERSLRYISRGCYTALVDPTLNIDLSLTAPKKASVTSSAFLAFITHITDAAELKLVQRKLKKNQAATEGTQEDDPTVIGSTSNGAGRRGLKQMVEVLAPLSQHESFAASILHDMLAELSSGDPNIPRRLSKILSYLNLYSAEKAASLTLVPLLDRVVQNTSDKQLLHKLQKFRETLVSIGYETTDGADDRLEAAVGEYRMKWEAAVAEIPVKAEEKAQKIPSKPGKRKRGKKQEECKELDFSDDTDDDVIARRKKIRSNHRKNRKRLPTSEDELEFDIQLAAAVDEDEDSDATPTGEPASPTTKKRVRYSSRNQKLCTDEDSTTDGEDDAEEPIG